MYTFYTLVIFKFSSWRTLHEKIHIGHSSLSKEHCQMSYKQKIAILIHFDLMYFPSLYIQTNHVAISMGGTITSAKQNIDHG